MPTIQAHFEQAVFRFLFERYPVGGSDRILLAVSGGADSMALLHALLRLREQGAVEAEWVVGHVNHRLRGQAADADQRFVEQYARQRGLEVISRSADVPAYARDRKVSIETAGRMLRIGALAEMARQCGAGAVATAHHRDDLAESMIFRLRRGTAFRGWQGIRPSGKLEGILFVRPLLGLRRRQILDYCSVENLPWREDATNADCGYARNRIRHHLLPYLHEKTQTDIAEMLACLAEKSRYLFERITAKVDDEMPGIVRPQPPHSIVLQKAALAKCSPIVRGEILRRCLVQLNVGLRDYTTVHYQQMMRCVCKPDLSRFQLPGNLECVSDGSALRLGKISSCESSLPDEPVLPEIGKPCRFGSFQITSTLLDSDQVSLEHEIRGSSCMQEYLDADTIKGAIRIRLRRPGDRFRPLGMKTEKKVGKFLTAAQVDLENRDQVFIVEDSEKILWVAPVRISESAKIGPKTSRILKIQMIPLKGVF